MGVMSYSSSHDNGFSNGTYYHLKLFLMAVVRHSPMSCMQVEYFTSIRY